MRPGLLLLVILASAAALSYLELRHQAAREAWRVETTRLSSRLEQAERLAEERAQALAAAERNDWQGKEASAELADLEAGILDAAAALAEMESERTVARDRADAATRDLKTQVRALTRIEKDMAAIDRRRQRLEHQVETVEEQLHESELEAAERQKRAEALDRDIARLAIRRETLLAGLDAAETTMTEVTTAEAVDDASTATVASSSPPPTAPAEASSSAPAAPTIVENAARENGAEPEEGRQRGLYQFGNLPVEAHAAGQGGVPPSSGGGSQDTDAEAAAEDWAEDQYLLGLSLLSTAEQNSGTRELNDAVLAFKAVLGEWPKQRDAKRWAIVRSDLGYAFALLGKRQGDAGLLEQAAAACREALGEFERGKTPLLWAAAQHHLGVSLSGLADVQDDQQLRRASIEALEAAVAVFKDAGAHADAGKVEKRLREVYAGLPAVSTE